MSNDPLQTFEFRCFVKGLCDYLVENAERESGFLYPDPQHILFVKPLVDHLIESSGIEKETIVAWLDEAADRKDALRHG